MATVVARDDLDAETAAVIRDTAEGLTGSIDALVDEVSHAIVDDVAGVLDGDSYRHSNLANLDLKLSLLKRAGDLVVPPPPQEAIVYARDLARHGSDLSVLLRSYEIGHRYFWRVWTQGFATRVSEPTVLADLFSVSARFLFDYFDSVPKALTGEYRAELQRCKSGEAARRAELVCKLLGGTEHDVEAAEHALGYSLTGGHVALVFDMPGSLITPEDARAGRRVAEHLAHRLGTRALVVQAETTKLWGWAEVSADMSPDTVDEIVCDTSPPNGMVLAVGDLGHGLDGFCESHREAEHALRFAGDRRRATPRLIRYRTISAVSLLSSDVKRAHRFIERELGALAVHDDATARVRATLRTFLSENCNQARTARRLGIHYNTVIYRIRQAEALLGRPVHERRFELEAALALHASTPEPQRPDDA